MRTRDQLEAIEWKNPDWSKIVTSGCIHDFFNSIRTILEGFLGMPIHLEKDKYEWRGFSYEKIYLFGLAVNVDGYSEFDYVKEKYPVDEARERLIAIVKSRWIDALYSLQEGINNRERILNESVESEND